MGRDGGNSSLSEETSLGTFYHYFILACNYMALHRAVERKPRMCGANVIDAGQVIIVFLEFFL